MMKEVKKCLKLLLAPSIIFYQLIGCLKVDVPGLNELPLITLLFQQRI